MQRVQWTRSSRVAAATAGIVALLVAAMWVLPGLNTTSANVPAGVVVDDTQLAAAVGWGSSTMCKKSYPCNTGFTEGSNCAYCDSSSNRTMCCSDGENTCEYLSPTGNHPCDLVRRMVGVTAGETGTCSTCTSSQFVQDETCSNIREAESSDTCNF